jgi:hypothetical protein
MSAETTVAAPVRDLRRQRVHATDHLAQNAIASRAVPELNMSTSLTSQIGTYG